MRKNNKNNIIDLSNKLTLFRFQIDSLRDSIMQEIALATYNQKSLIDQKLDYLAYELLYHYKLNPLQANIVNKIITYDTSYILEVIIKVLYANVNDDVSSTLEQLKSNHTLRKCITNFL